MPQTPLVIDTARMAELRAARAEDITAIVAIDPHSPGRPGQIQALVREQASLVAVEHGQIVGFLAVRPGHFYQRDFIDLLFVAPRSRRQGAGRALLQAALRNASTPRMFTSTNESNTPMRELLHGEGWTPSGVLTGLDEGDPQHVFFHDARQPRHHRTEDHDLGGSGTGAVSAHCGSVSSPRPSNRACGSPAHGLPTFFTVGVRPARARTGRAWAG